ncbi:carbohydrate kinase family protein, partial [Streptomyces sp. SID7982]|nr:carbohydrate kinase family protein [Streptomyces sp. SID7982]
GRGVVTGHQGDMTSAGGRDGQLVGTAGCLWAVRGGEPTVVPGPEVRVVDAAGADDVFAAALTVAVGEGRP